LAGKTKAGRSMVHSVSGCTLGVKIKQRGGLSVAVGRPSIKCIPKFGQPFFYMAFACCVNVYMVSVHMGST